MFWCIHKGGTKESWVRTGVRERLCGNMTLTLSPEANWLAG